MQIAPSKAMRVETFSEYPHVGQFAVQDMTQTAVLGDIKAADKKSSPASKVPESTVVKRALCNLRYKNYFTYYVFTEKG